MPKNILKHAYLSLKGISDDVTKGECFHYGNHVKKNIETAIFYYNEAAKRGDPRAFRLLSQLSSEEHRLGESFYFTGIMYELLMQWDQAVIAHQHAAAIENYAPAMYRLGQIYQKGRFSKERQSVLLKNATLELLWYRKAAAAYYSPALVRLIALSNLRPDAAFQLGQMYELGEIGNKINIKSALKCYEKACTKRHKEAAFCIGSLLENRPKQLRRCFKYYMIAAAQKHAGALAAMIRIAENHLGDPSYYLRVGQVYENLHDLISALKCYKFLADKDNEEAMTRISRLITRNADLAYNLAKLYEADADNESSFKKACHYYVAASIADHQRAIDALKTLAKSGKADAQYALAYGYYRMNGQIDKAIPWFLLAADQQQSQAINYLAKAFFSVEQYIEIAKKYDRGVGVKKNLDLAIRFYEKAFQLKNKEAAFRLGQLHEVGTNDLAVNPHKAFNYYAIAAKQGDVAALRRMEVIMGLSKLDSHVLQVGQIYIENFNDSLPALKCYKYLADKGNASAITHIDALIAKHATYAYELAKLYEVDTNMARHLQKVCFYYAIAARANSRRAYEALEALANAGKADAQYALGYEFYHKKGQVDKAISWCLLAAEQQHSQAGGYLAGTCFLVDKYIELAHKYDQGVGVKKNIILAIQFYEKAYQLKSKEAALRLGQLYQLDFNIPSLPNNFDKACECFIKAITWGHLDALTSIVTLSDDISPKMQLKVGDMFRDKPSNDSARARYWYEKAHQNGIQEAQQRLKDLNLRTSFNSTSSFFTEKPNVLPNTVHATPCFGNARLSHR